MRKRLDMIDDDLRRTVQVKERVSTTSRQIGTLNIVLLIGTAVMAITLVVTPMLAERTDSRRLASTLDDYDDITTGSIRKPESGKRYTIRRSVLQETPGSVCIVQGYGAGSGC